MSAIDVTTLLISLKTAGAATVLAFVFGLAAARLMAGKGFRGKSLVDAVLLAPLVLPPTVVGFLLLVLFGADSPLGVAIERIFGTGLLFTWPAAVIAATVVAFPLMYRTARGALEQVDARLPAAARTLGAREWRVFVDVLGPLARPGIIAGTVLAFARALGEFGATLMIAGNLPGRTRTIPLAIYSDVETGDLGQAAVWAGLVIVLTIALATLSNVWGARPSKRPFRATSAKPVDSDRQGRGLASARRTEGERSLSVDVVHRLPDFVLDASFSAVRPVAVLGASGAGKSLLLRCLSGLERPESGKIQINGRTVYAQGHIDLPARARRIGHVFQGYALFPHLSVFDNVAFGLRDMTSEARRRHVWSWLESTDLVPFAHRYPGELSGGQAQRAALARALATTPELLLLDEPFAALDSHLKSRIEQRVAEAVRSFPGVSVLVTHNLEEAFRIADDLIVLDQGRVVATGPKHEVFAQPGNLATATLTGCKNIAPCTRLSSRQVEVAGWGCRLELPRDVADATHIGVRAHHIKLSDSDPGLPNSFRARVQNVNESPFRMTVQVAPFDESRTPLQVEVDKDRWAVLAASSSPLFVSLSPDSLMVLRDHR